MLADKGDLKDARVVTQGREAVARFAPSGILIRQVILEEHRVSGTDNGG
jgi:hypothetical protein